MKNTYLVYILTVFILSISCSQLDDSFRLPGEDSDDIVYYELNNDYLAPESREFIESNFPSVNVNSSYILIGKNTYGFEADLTNEMSLSFDEDGVFKFDREHPFIKDYYKKGKNGKGIGGGGKGEGRGEGEGKDEGKDEGKGKGEESERCFEFIMPYKIMMPDSSIITLILILALLVTVEPAASMISIGVMSLIYILIAFVTKNRLSYLSLIAAKNRNEVVKLLQEGLNGIRDILIDGTQNIFADLYGSQFNTKSFLILPCKS